jgi:hypothetical protein
MLDMIDRRLHALLLALTLGACKKDEPDAAPSRADEDAARAQPAEANAGPAKTPASPSGTAEKLIEWLDPDAVAVLYSKLPPTIDTDALSVVFAVPQKTARMLRANANLVEALDAVLPAEAPRPDQWLGPETLATASAMSTGTYVLRPLTRPRDEVQALLEGAGMHPTVIEGITILVPRGAFPWKAAFVTDEVLAFILIKEIGSGLNPLTAGRDMPPSEIAQALLGVTRNEPDAVLELYAAGPLVHFDIGQDVLQLMLRVRRWERQGLDVEVRMQTSRDPHEASEKLGQRKTPLETDQIQALVDRVAFSVDQDTVMGRLQLGPEDLAVLEAS